MLNDAPIKVGDELVEFGKVYKVFKIEDKLTYEGKVEPHIFFKPIYDTQDNRTLSCCIPLKNVSFANIRRPLTKKEMLQVFESLSNMEVANMPQILDINEARDILKKNNPTESAKVLRSMWVEINKDAENTTKSRKDIFELSIKNLTQEVAFTFDLSLENAEKKLQKALTKTS